MNPDNRFKVTGDFGPDTGGEVIGHYARKRNADDRARRELRPGRYDRTEVYDLMAHVGRSCRRRFTLAPEGGIREEAV